jgi:hypothetical protein
VETVVRSKNRYPYYGKKKLKVPYEKNYCEETSIWKVERVIRRYKLYPDPKKKAKTSRKAARARQKTRLVKKGRLSFLFQLDCIVISLA